MDNEQKRRAKGTSQGWLLGDNLWHAVQEDQSKIDFF